MNGALGRFRPDDAVRVVRVLVAEREVTGSSATPPQPRVGDGLYLVESCTDDGMTIWMTELAAAELELVDRTGGGF